MRGRRVAYPRARYQDPVIVNPAALDWQPTDMDGVARERLGLFDHDFRMEAIRLGAGHGVPVDARRATQLLFVLAGESTMAGHRWGRRSRSAGSRSSPMPAAS